MTKSVLIVDDAAFMRMMLKKILTAEDFEVVAEASDGREAIKKYEEHEPDLVTMDITMPDMDGLEAVKEILDYDEDAKIIMVSAMGQQKMVVEAVQAGAEDFVVKPFEEERVLEAVGKVFS